MTVWQEDAARDLVLNAGSGSHCWSAVRALTCGMPTADATSTSWRVSR